MAKSFDLSGKIALVTGASGGLGRHFAGVLAGAGARVAVCARRMDKVTETVAGIESAGGRAFGVEMDVTDKAPGHLQPSLRTPQFRPIITRRENLLPVW